MLPLTHVTCPTIGSMKESVNYSTKEDNGEAGKNKDASFKSVVILGREFILFSRK